MKDIEKQLCQHPLWMDLKKVSQKISEAGFFVVLVGGALRDALLGLEVKDLDLASSATHSDLKKLFLGVKDLCGTRYGVSIIPCKQSKGFIEVTTFRKESAYKDGRRPSHVESGSIEEDVKRRDLSINALFYDIKHKKLLDYVGGLQDLENKILKTVGDASSRFQEDHLRLLRALRFAHQFQFSIERQTAKALKKEMHSLKKISQERKTKELFKMLSFHSNNVVGATSAVAVGAVEHVSEGALEDVVGGVVEDVVGGNTVEKNSVEGALSQAFKLLEKYQALEVLFPFKDFASQNAHAFWNQKFSFLKESSYLWMVVGLPYFKQKENIKTFKSFLESLKLSSQEVKRSLFYFDSLLSLTSDLNFIQKAKIFAKEEDRLQELLLSYYQSFQKNLKELKLFLNQFQELKKSHGGCWPEALITGKDLLELAYKPSKNFQNLLEQAYNYQLENPQSNKQSILDYLKKIKSS